ncbi:MAG: response regulator [Candidatus Latescibacteria bacterium]|nr:response regulator [Candidatus Latescibacterota bacterium]
MNDGNSSDKNPKRILVLEDMDGVRTFISEVLSSRGYQVSAPVDSYVAFAMARQQSFDLMTVDLYMPLIDGVTFIRALHDMGIHIPAVVITAYSTDPKVEEMKRLGIRHFLPKPFRLEDLFEAVKEVLEGPLRIAPTPGGT